MTYWWHIFFPYFYHTEKRGEKTYSKSGPHKFISKFYFAYFSNKIHRGILIYALSTNHKADRKQNISQLPVVDAKPSLGPNKQAWTLNWMNHSLADLVLKNVFWLCSQWLCTQPLCSMNLEQFPEDPQISEQRFVRPSIANMESDNMLEQVWMSVLAWMPLCDKTKKTAPDSPRYTSHTSASNRQELVHATILPQRQDFSRLVWCERTSRSN